MVRQCSAIGCNHTDANKSIRFFKTPDKNAFPALFQEWQSSAKSTLSKSSFFCSLHFDEGDFANKSKTRLSHGASPKIPSDKNTRQAPTHVVNLSVWTGLSEIFLKVEDYVVKVNLSFSESRLNVPDATIKARKFPSALPKSIGLPERKGVKRLHNAMKNTNVLSQRSRQLFWKKAYDNAIKDRRNNTIHKHRAAKQLRIAKKETLKFYKTRMQMCFTDTQIRRILTGKRVVWKPEDIAMGIRIRYSAHPYEQLRKLGLPLPSSDVLRRCLHDIEFKPGLIEPILEILKEEFKNATPFERQCVVMFDEMGIDPKYEYFDQGDRILGGRKNATVFLVRGLFAPWKQVFAFDFCEALTKARFIHYIAKLESVGLIVRNVVCDMGGKNRSLWKNLGIGVTEEGGELKISNSIQSPITNTRMCFMADVPHLIKLLRNHTFSTGINIDGKNVINKKDFHHLIKAELPNEIKQLFKLKESHLDLSNIEKMKVGPALAVYSLETSVAWLHHFPAREIEAQFIKTIRIGFEILTSRGGQNQCQNFAHFGENLQQQRDNLKKLGLFISNLRVLGHKSRLPFQNGWLVSIESTLKNYEDLHNGPMNVSYLKTGRSTQDALENVFSVIRGLGQTRNPTASEFIRRLKLQCISSAPLISKRVSTMIDDDNVPLLSSKMLSTLRRNSVTSVEDDNSMASSSNFHLAEPSNEYANHDVEMSTPRQEPDAVRTEVESESVLEDEALDYVLGYVAKQLESKFPVLSANREEYDKIPNHWINRLHNVRSNITLPSETWRIWGSQLNEEFLILHGRGVKVSMSEGIRKDFGRKLQSKYPHIPAEVITLFLKHREKIRLNHVNEAQNQKLAHYHNIEKERYERLQRLASELPDLLNENEEFQYDASEFERNECHYRTLFGTETFFWSQNVSLVAQDIIGSNLKETQRISINALLTGLDVIVNMPTGSGKSAIFQIATLVGKGFSLVVSPLVSIIEDQVRTLRSKNIDCVALYDTTVDSAAEGKHLAEVLQNETVRFVYVTPEKLKHFLPLKKILSDSLGANWPFTLIVVDEAHCYSDWGKSFRKDYLDLRSIKQDFPTIPILAMSGTLTPALIEEFKWDLKLSSAVVLRDSVFRGNLKYSVQYTNNQKDAEILEFLLSRPQDCGIVYCQTIPECNRLYQKMRGLGILCDVFEANLHTEAKKRLLHNWLNGSSRVMVATSAFGMGIDRKDCRFVVHYSPPRNFNDYLQQCGRAGRDGKPSDCILFFNYDDAISSLSRTYQTRNGLNTMHEFLKYCLLRDKCRNTSIGDVFGEALECGELKCDNCEIKSPVQSYDAWQVINRCLQILKRAEKKHTRITMKSILLYLQGRNCDKSFNDLAFTTSVSSKTLEQCILLGLVGGYFAEVFDYGRLRTTVYLKRGPNADVFGSSSLCLFCLNCNEI